VPPLTITRGTLRQPANVPTTGSFESLLMSTTGVAGSVTLTLSIALLTATLPMTASWSFWTPLTWTFSLVLPFMVTLLLLRTP
jgi:hypothetical protein